MEFTLTIKGDAQELAALLSQIKVPPASKATVIDLPGLGPVPVQTNGHVPPEPEAVVEAAPTEAPPPRTRAPRTQKPAAPVVAAIPEDEAPAPVAPVEAPVETKPATLDGLRKVMATKLKHQAVIIGWLGEFGAKNLSALDAAHYEAMYEKLNSLD